jgi:hypothetical protein
MVAVPVEDGVQVGQVGLGGVGREFALEGLAGNARLLKRNRALWPSVRHRLRSH